MSYRHHSGNSFDLKLLKRNYHPLKSFCSTFFLLSYVSMYHDFQCEYQSPSNRINQNGVGAGWAKGAYICKCRKGYYDKNQHQSAFNGILVES